MTNCFSILPLSKLLSYIDFENAQKPILGIPDELIFNPVDRRLFTERYGKTLHIPLGVAAGPHTQLAQNIVSAWLCGARYIELKTVQTLDELEISKPCIDASDEAYNCEWSQELKINESFDQYLNAWIIIHLIAHKRGLDNIGTIFNMSAGYNLEGILKDNMQWFFSKMKNCKIEKEEKLNSITAKYPWVQDVVIPDCISDNITLSTMHGCPPDEIENIANYLLNNLKLHTTVKLNPTLLGKQEVNEIISKSGFNIKVPDSAFEHDLKYHEAVEIIKNLDKNAKSSNLNFGVKLTNTLETLNIKKVLPSTEKTHYMSGRALHPIGVKLALMLQQEFKGELDISFSAGADCYNFPELIACNLQPVTVCTDILKPGGYFRLKQYSENLIDELNKTKSESISDYISSKSGLKNKNEAIIENLKNYLGHVLDNDYYKFNQFKETNIKTDRTLNFFDCINAPCVDNCPTNQDIPSYMYFTSQKEYNKALEVITETNPFPNVTGKICDHPCQLKCTRMNYDEPLKIREIKRFVSESAVRESKAATPKNRINVSVIGAGPSGLSCAYYLSKKGVNVTIYEKKSYSGGMVQSLYLHLGLATML
jgi:putative selenate reductase